MPPGGLAELKRRKQEAQGAAASDPAKGQECTDGEQKPGELQHVSSGLLSHTLHTYFQKVRVQWLPFSCFSREYIHFAYKCKYVRGFPVFSKGFQEVFRQHRHDNGDGGRIRGKRASVV